MKSSKNCSVCHGPVENARFKCQGSLQMTRCHQVVRCKSCSIFWQRDVNAARNIQHLLVLQEGGQARPEQFFFAKAKSKSKAMHNAPGVTLQESIVQAETRTHDDSLVGRIFLGINALVLLPRGVTGKIPVT